MGQHEIPTGRWHHHKTNGKSRLGHTWVRPEMHISIDKTYLDGNGKRKRVRRRFTQLGPWECRVCGLKTTALGEKPPGPDNAETYVLSEEEHIVSLTCEEMIVFHIQTS